MARGIEKNVFAKSVRANGWMSGGVAVERSVRALTRRLMRWLRYRGTECSNTAAESW